MENILNEKDLNQAEMEETTVDEMLRTEELEDMALDDAVDQEDPETAPVEGQIDKEEEILNHGEGNHSGRTMGRRQTKARRLLEQMSQPEPQIKHSVLAGRTERVETGLDNNDIQVSNARRENRIIEGTIESVRLRGNGRIVLSISDYCGYRVVIDEENMGVTIRRKEDETDMQYRRKMMRVFESMIGIRSSLETARGPMRSGQALRSGARTPQVSMCCRSVPRFPLPCCRYFASSPTLMCLACRTPSPAIAFERAMSRLSVIICRLDRKSRSTSPSWSGTKTATC